MRPVSGVPALAVVNYFLDKGRQEGRSLTPMMLQKLLYFAHGWHYGKLQRRLIREPIEMWKWGPVVRNVYRKLRVFGSSPVEGPIAELHIRPRHDAEGDLQLYGKSEVPLIPEGEDWDDTRSVLDFVWDRYSRSSPNTLSRLTHKKGTPWDRTLQECGGEIIPDMDIPDAYIVEHFERAERENAYS